MNLSPAYLKQREELLTQRRMTEKLATATLKFIDMVGHLL
jgi:hypothetical protein